MREVALGVVEALLLLRERVAEEVQRTDVVGIGAHRWIEDGDHLRRVAELVGNARTEVRRRFTGELAGDRLRGCFVTGFDLRERIGEREVELIGMRLAEWGEDV